VTTLSRQQIEETMTSPADIEHRLRERLRDFDDEVAEHLANETERADLWTEIDVPVSYLREAADTIAQLVKALDECEAALKLTECPHPARGRPADDMAEACLDSGNCGCCYGTAFMDIRRARTQQHGAKE
jgi:hypothetical protein